MNSEIQTGDEINKQYEMPFAIVEGEPVTELPQDLYIPPFALKVFLEAFEGPLDLSHIFNQKTESRYFRYTDHSNYPAIY